MKYPDTRTEEYINFMGGPKDDGWEIIPKHVHEIFTPVVPSMALWKETEAPVTAVMKVGIYRYKGRDRMAENLFGVPVRFRIFEWEGER